MDDLILTGLLEDAEEIIPQLESINQRLATKEDQLELYEEFGQIVDRLFGVLGMMDFPELTAFFGIMKETCYKCSRCDDDRAYSKVMELMISLVEHLKVFKICHSDPGELKTLCYKVNLDVKRAERIVAGVLYSIRDGSVKTNSVELNALIFDKLDKLTSMVTGNNDIIYPTPVLYNATAGFIKKLQDKDFNIGMILIDTTVSKNVFLPLIESCNEFRPGIPIALLTNDPEAFGTVDIEKMNITMVEKFPQQFKGLKSLIQKLSLKEERAAVNNNTSKIEFDATTFIEIQALNIHLCKSNPFDIYIKVNNKLIKISNENSNLTEEQINGHNSKGIDHYYVKKEDYQEYLDVCNAEINRVLKDPNIDLGVQVSKTLSLGAEVYSYLEHCGVDKKNITEAYHFVEKTLNILDHVKLENGKGKGNELLARFMDDLANQEHAVSVSMFAGIFLESLGASAKVKQNIILTAFLHDIGLCDASDIIKEEDESKLNEKEKEILYHHPGRGAQMLKEMGLKDVLLDAIEQHHVRMENKGFPKWEQGSVNKLNNIAEVIGLSEELSRIVASGDEKKKANLFLHVNIEDYSPTVQRAYRELFKF